MFRGGCDLDPLLCIRWCVFVGDRPGQLRSWAAATSVVELNCGLPSALLGAVMGTTSSSASGGWIIPCQHSTQ
ncbi:hypothetical protein PISMIDRAFT_674868 [Pisolithus microcarpus 441]|uniref:Uncharacterized protein n=1 Tax=Pisolithus microcarpus 441 TaxID=765257 RepID=A0A0C9ZZ93_9AGAM|nr:hypothetical protein PISMIDRAFT_674868 [Pisolithus microcarpus 441]